MPKAQPTVSVEDKAGPARRLVCPGSPVNARASITVNACPVAQQLPGLLPPQLELEALRRRRPPGAALALGVFRMRVST